MGETRVRKRPCGSCPYRQDVPSGVWEQEEYEKLRAYDGTIAEQAIAGAGRLFMCHQGDGNLCAGWAGCHGMRDLFAARLHAGLLHESVWDYESPVPLFSSGAEAAEHGEADLDWPSPEAEAVVEKITRAREARGIPVKDK